MRARYSSPPELLRVETVGEEYLETLVEGEYDPYKSLYESISIAGDEILEGRNFYNIHHHAYHHVGGGVVEFCEGSEEKKTYDLIRIIGTPAQRAGVRGELEAFLQEIKQPFRVVKEDEL